MSRYGVHGVDYIEHESGAGDIAPPRRFMPVPHPPVPLFLAAIAKSSSGA